MAHKIGILGDGQLAKMLIEAGQPAGFEFGVYGSDPEGPCKGLAQHFLGPADNSEALTQFAKQFDIITLENEFFSPQQLAVVEGQLAPSLKSFRLIENKISEKEFAASVGIPLSKYQVGGVDLLSESKVPFVCKLPKGGYDGKGTFIVSSEKAKQDLLGQPWKPDALFIVEDLLSLSGEVAVTVARSTTGDTSLFPVVDTVQENGICVRVEFPSLVSEAVQEQVSQMALQFVNGLEYVGVLSLEFFVTNDSKVFFNESAPRPHNSAHYSMDALSVSQFLMHLQAITGQVLPKTEPKYRRSIMINLLGTQEGSPALHVPENIQNQFFIHTYNKQQSRVGRKMGHINLVGTDMQSLREDASTLIKGARI